MVCCSCGSDDVVYDPNPYGLPVIAYCLMGAPLTGEPGACRCVACGSLDIDERTAEERDADALGDDTVPLVLKPTTVIAFGKGVAPREGVYDSKAKTRRSGFWGRLWAWLKLWW